MSDDNSKEYTPGLIAAAILLVFLIYGLCGFLFKEAWNITIAPTVGVNEISFYQALWLLIPIEVYLGFRSLSSFKHKK